MRAFFHQQYGRVLHGQLATQVGVDPFHRRILEGLGALGNKVEHVVRPVLDGGVAAAPAFLHDDLDDSAVQAVGAVGRRRAALDVMHPRALVDDDECTLELPHVLRVDAEVGLQRHFHLHARWHIDEGAAGPDGGVQRRKLVVVPGDDGAEVFPHKFRIFTEGAVHIKEDDAPCSPDPRECYGTPIPSRTVR